jgi:hypothetical protein
VFLACQTVVAFGRIVARFFDDSRVRSRVVE